MQCMQLIIQQASYAIFIFTKSPLVTHVHLFVYALWLTLPPLHCEEWNAAWDEITGLTHCLVCTNTLHDHQHCIQHLANIWSFVHKKFKLCLSCVVYVRDDGWEIEWKTAQRRSSTSGLFYNIWFGVIFAHKKYFGSFRNSWKKMPLKQTCWR